jgi:hypothetical protein
MIESYYGEFYGFHTAPFHMTPDASLLFLTATYEAGGHPGGTAENDQELPEDISGVTLEVQKNLGVYWRRQFTAN